jgi:hypothetical protein
MDAGSWGSHGARIAIVAALLLGLTPTVAAGADSKRRSPCPRAAVERSSAATLFIRDDDVDDVHYLVGCLKSTRRRTVLASWFAQGSSTDDPAPQYWLTGRFAAVNQAACPGDPTSSEPCTGSLRVVDLRARRTHATVATGSPIFDLFLTRRGSVGLIHRNELITAVGAVVQVHDSEAETWSLAYAEEAERLYWTGAGEPRSTTLR